MKKENLLPYNLQFFAADPEPTPEPEPIPEPEPNPEPTPSIEEQIQQLMNENAKLKKAQEKAASEAADYKKKWNASLTDVQRASQEKAEKEAEREEKFNQLLKENTVTKYEKNFLALGYPEDLASKAANAQYENDADALFKAQSEYKELLIKQKETEWQKTRPQPNFGTGSDGIVTKEQFEKMGMAEKSKLYRENKVEYDRLNG